MDTVYVVYVSPDLYFLFGTCNNIQKKEKKRLMLIPYMEIPHLQLPRNNVSHAISYFYNEKQVLCQG